MVRFTVHTEGKVAVVRCRGSILAGNDTRLLRDAVLSRSGASTLVLDLGQVDRIDAGCLGLLIDLCKWTRSLGTQLKLVSVPRRVHEVLELTHLNRVLEIVSDGESDRLPDRLGPSSRGDCIFVSKRWLPLLST